MCVARCPVTRSPSKPPGTEGRPESAAQKAHSRASIPGHQELCIPPTPPHSRQCPSGPPPRRNASVSSPGRGLCGQGSWTSMAETPRGPDGVLDGLPGSEHRVCPYTHTHVTHDTPLHTHHTPHTHHTHTLHITHTCTHTTHTCYTPHTTHKYTHVTHNTHTLQITHI